MKHTFYVACMVIATHTTILASEAAPTRTHPTALPERSISPTTTAITDALIRTIINAALQSEFPDPEHHVETSNSSFVSQRPFSQTTPQDRRPDSPWPTNDFERIL